MAPYQKTNAFSRSPSPARRRSARRKRRPGGAEAAQQRRLVGLGRFELPTSRLSSARSNQLSYRPRAHAHCPRYPERARAQKDAPTTLGIAWARPRRKRNEDGEVPPKDMPILK